MPRTVKPDIFGNAPDPEGLVFVQLKPHSGKTMTFALGGELPKFGYKVDIKETRKRKLTHPSLITYQGGRVDDITMKVVLAVGVSWGFHDKRVQSGKDLWEICQEMYSMCLDVRTGGGKEQNHKGLIYTSRLSVGDGKNKWLWSIKVIPRNFEFIGKAPYDEDGYPMIVEAQFTFTPYFSSQTWGGKNGEPQRVTGKHLPRKGWTFK